MLFIASGFHPEASENYVCVGFYLVKGMGGKQSLLKEIDYGKKERERKTSVNMYIFLSECINLIWINTIRTYSRGVNCSGCVVLMVAGEGGR